jgi:methylmalonyl-CoA mutase, C-terminal domain
MQRKIRVLVGKPGLDGHDRGAKVVAAALRDAGMEVIYTGLHQTPEQIVEAAAQEDVDVVALSILSGAHMTQFPEVMKLMRSRGIGDRLLTGGGIIPPDDMGTLAGMGVGRLFGPGASTQDIAGYIREWFGATHRDDAPARAAAPARRTPTATPARKSAAKAKPAPKAKRVAKAKPAAKAKPKTKPRPKRASAAKSKGRLAKPKGRAAKRKPAAARRRRG